MGTSSFSTPSRGRRLALGTAAVVTVGLASAYASVTGAQTSSDPIRTEIVSVDGTGSVQQLPETAVPAISDTGGVVVYDTLSPIDPDAPGESTEKEASFEGRRVFIRDRVAGTSRPVAESGSVAPGVSGNGCLVAYTVVSADVAELTVVDRCAPPVEFPLPIGTVLDTMPLETTNVDNSTVESDLAGTGPADDAEDAGDVEGNGAGNGEGVASPALSFDGSTIVWSTGREVRRYARPVAGGAHVRTHTFDVVSGGSPDHVTGAQSDVSADGDTVVFVAGPGSTPFSPTIANVYVWTLSTPQLDPEPLSVTATGDPGTTESGSPTISADGSYAVFESSGPELAAVGSTPVTTPFVVGVDLIAGTGQVLVDDAGSPATSADGNHVVYRRGAAVRVLSSLTTSTVDHAIEELVDARPASSLAISQFGRWIVFASAADLEADSADAPEPVEPTAPAIWAVDRASSYTAVVDTTTPPTTSTTVPDPPTTPSVPAATVPESSPTVPATTSASSPVVPRFPTATNGFPRVVIPPAPRRVGTSTSDGRFGSTVDPASDSAPAAFASPVSFEPTVIEVGRRTLPVTLTNATAQTLQVADVSIDVPGAFAVVADRCSGTPVAQRSSCTVEVQFAPSAVGPASASLTFRLSDGSLVTATLDGEGVPEPTLDLVPIVAGAGQTVTVFGAGFPAGSTVELSQPGSSTTELIAVDLDGTFAHVVVVLPNTPTGPAVLSVGAQPDAFDVVSAELLVSSRGATSADAALRSRLAGALGR